MIVVGQYFAFRSLVSLNVNCLLGLAGGCWQDRLVEGCQSLLRLEPPLLKNSWHIAAAPQRLKFESRQCQDSLSCSFFQQIILGGPVGKGDLCSKPANYCLPFNLSFWVDLKLLVVVACLQQLCGHLLKFKTYLGSPFPSHGRCGTFVVSGYLPHVISWIAPGVQELFHLHMALTIAHLATLT